MEVLTSLRTGLEYDLDLFNIVAVDDFNMGAMENKSLNVFNSRLVIASPATSTDLDYARVEGVVGHEYFHNWTGNRVTCRDWFQLTLKEGLTVFRDQVGPLQHHHLTILPYAGSRRSTCMQPSMRAARSIYAGHAMQVASRVHTTACLPACAGVLGGT